MAYGVKYTGSFDNSVNERYRMDILEKDYEGDSFPMLLAGVPVKHQWQTDDPKAPIKGSSLILTILNPGGPQNQSEFSAEVLPRFEPSGEHQSFLIITGTDFVPEIGVPFTISGHSDPTVNTTYAPADLGPIGPGSYFVYLADDALDHSSAAEMVTISTYVAQTAALPITTFYSTNEDQFKGIFYKGEDVLFVGFLVQDDCREDMVDYVHEIQLSFNDNLGLLKDISLNSNLPDFGGDLASVQLDFISPVPDNFIYLYNTTFIPEVGVPFTVAGHIDATANDTWTPTAVVKQGNGNWQVQVADLAFAADTVAWPAVITTGGGNIDPLNRNSLLNIIRVCIYNTGLELETVFFCNLFESSQDNTRVCLEQTYIDAQTFISGETYDDCYTVLTKILDRFNLTLFQALGQWCIVRWDELRYGDIGGFRYDDVFSYSSTDNLSGNISTGFEQFVYPEVGLSRSIFRPYEYDKETFNYRIPKYLVKNYDLQTLGELLTTYTDGPNTINEYEMPDWLDYRPGTFPATFFIRVTSDTATGSELSRYIVIKGQSSGIVGTPFEVSANDRVKVEFTFYTTASQSGPISYVDNLLLTDGTTDNYADEASPTGWDTGPGWDYGGVGTGDNSNIKHTVTIEPGGVPYDGLIYVILLEKTNTPGPDDETIISDLRVTYTPYINDSAKIIGHIHKETETNNFNIKNNEDIEIFTDDSPRSSVIGTLFKPSFTGFLQNRTTQWYRLTNNTETLKLGQITTLEQLFWRRAPRTKVEGTFYWLNGVTLSMLSVLKNISLDDRVFIYGSLEIDYKNSNLNCTMWEIFEEGETDEDLDGLYSFTYIYDTK